MTAPAREQLADRWCPTCDRRRRVIEASGAIVCVYCHRVLEYPRAPADGGPGPITARPISPTLEARLDAIEDRQRLIKANLLAIWGALREGRSSVPTSEVAARVAYAIGVIEAGGDLLPWERDADEWGSWAPRAPGSR